MDNGEKHLVNTYWGSFLLDEDSYQDFVLGKHWLCMQPSSSPTKKKKKHVSPRKKVEQEEKSIPVSRKKSPTSSEKRKSKKAKKSFKKKGLGKRLGFSSSHPTFHGRSQFYRECQGGRFSGK